ncbi:MAG: glycosyl transferase [Deltaproteobacteria bacterium]|nr:MAG: glycosyl transferase [Deltaproteobacteria bacterium]
MLTPEISVLLPYRDAAATIDEALASVLQDGSPQIEVLAVDDGSEDDGPRRVHERATKDARIRCLESHGAGIVGALNRAVSAARAPVFARMDADDVSLPGRFEAQLALLEAHPEVAIVAARVRNLADAPIGRGLERYVAWQNDLLTARDHDRDIFVESPLCHPSVMMRRDAFEAVGGYRESPWAEDYDLWLRLWHAGHRFMKVPEVYLEWRNRAGRLTHTDPRLSEEAFRRAKAHYLAPWVTAGGRPLTIWGAGPTGKRMARALEAHGVFAARFVDVDPKKIGGTARGVPIAAIESLSATAETVLAAVGNARARGLIRADLDARGFVEGMDYRVVA